MNKFYKNNNLQSYNSKDFDWSLIQVEMKNKLGLDVFESWLKKIEFIEEFNNYILLSVPTRFIRDWITSRYLDQILKIIKSIVTLFSDKFSKSLSTIFISDKLGDLL